MKFLLTLSLFASLGMTACAPGSDSETASLDAAKKANSEDRLELWRAKYHGDDADEAAELVFKAGIPENLKTFYSDDIWRFLNYKTGDKARKNGDNLVYNKPTKAEVNAKCQELIKAIDPLLGDKYRDQDACWELVKQDDGEQRLVIHMFMDTPQSVHGHLPEALFAGFFEGTVAHFESAAKDAQTTVEEMTADANEDDIKHAVELIKAVVSVRHDSSKANPNDFALTALKELGSESLAYYKETFGSDVPEELAKNPIVENFLLSELMAAYYGSQAESQEFKDALPKTYAIAKMLGKHFGPAHWQIETK